tara:strand:+ start:196 stop:597 length:402 start_codon:yes stop_codon:yes gene_type:complete
MKKSRFKVRTEAREIELSPLIDMVFILLIFFIVTTVFVDERGFQTAQSRPAQEIQEEKEPLVFVVRASGAIEHQGRVVGLAGIASNVRSQVGRGRHPVVIQVEKGAKSGLAVQAMDRARSAGAEIINFSKSVR